MVACIGPLATVNCEPRQAWKGAAAAVAPCAGVWWVRVASILLVAPALSDLPDYGVKNPHLRFVNCGFCLVLEQIRMRWRNYSPYISVLSVPMLYGNALNLG